MLLILLWIVIAAIVILFLALLALKNDTFYIAKFLRSNQERTSFCFIKNDTTMIALEENRLMPLASTVKILIAIEYVRQVESGKLDRNEKIGLIDIERFYIKNTDGGAHPAWLKYMKKKHMISNDSVTLHNVVRGMISHSSNANSEYLMFKLGIDNINTGIKNIKIVDHTPIYPFVSSLLNCSLNKTKSPSEFEVELKELSMEEYIFKANYYHDSLRMLEKNELPVEIENIPLSIQKIWSDRLPASSAQEYAKLMNKINAYPFFDTSSANYLKELLKPQKDFINDAKLITTYGTKGGSTAFVLTKASFLTDNNKNNYSMALFFKDLKDWESIILQWNLIRFEKKMFFDTVFREKVINYLR